MWPVYVLFDFSYMLQGKVLLESVGNDSDIKKRMTVKLKKW